MRPSTSARGGYWWLPCAFLSLVAGVGLAACSGTHERVQHSPDVPHHVRVVVAPTTNLPRLLNQPIEQLQRQLTTLPVLPGALIDGVRMNDLAPRATDSLLTFRAGGLLLIASYDIHTRRVHDMLLLGHHEDSLMQRAALRFDATTYLVLPTFQMRPTSKFVGLRIIPTSQQ